jgi:hypothetical protein
MDGTTIKRKTALGSILGGAKPAAAPQQSGWADLAERIRDGQLIPIVSDSIRLEQIFQKLPELLQAGEDPGSVSQYRSILSMLSEAWAEEIEYPLQDSQELPRVAQYNHVRSADWGSANKSYLKYLKTALLGYAQALGADADLVEELQGRINEASFADLVSELEYPPFPSGQTDPFRILARLPLPIYITTSFSDFLERALIAEGKNPCTQICFWSGAVPNLAPEHETDQDISPTASAPLVYHLFGLERYPTTLVLSEDDYLDFLVKVTQDTDSGHPIIPLALRSALSVSSLLLVGFHLQDWDFRVLFRGVINSAPIEQRRSLSLIIQLAPGEQFHVTNDQEARKYLETYFKPSLFNVEWNRSEEFLNKLWSEWNKWRQGQ